MKKMFLAAMLFATATVSRVEAQTKTFYGCGTFSCHTATFTMKQISPISAYGQTWTQSLRIDWTHVFSEAGGHFGRGPTFIYPRPIAGNGWLSLWGPDSELSAWCSTGSWCRNVTHRETLENLADATYTVNGTTVKAFAGPSSVMISERDLTPEFISLQLVPEPATWALLAGGLCVLGVARRRRAS